MILSRYSYPASRDSFSNWNIFTSLLLCRYKQTSDPRILSSDYNSPVRLIFLLPSETFIWGISDLAIYYSYPV